MSKARATLMVLSGIVVAMATLGCGQGKDDQIQMLQEQVYDLQRENDNLRTRLARAVADRDDAIERAGRLQQENRDLRMRIREIENQEPAQAGDPWIKQGQWVYQSLETDLLFDSGKASLKQAGKTKLQEVAAQIQQQFPDKMVWVIGHTDTDPIAKTKHLWKDNLDLSVNRGMTVYHELMRLGIAPQRLIAGGQGEYNPVAPNNSRANKGLNRRVQIVVVPSPEEGLSGTGAPATSVGAASTSTSITAERRLPEK